MSLIKQIFILSFLFPVVIYSQKISDNSITLHKLPQLTFDEQNSNITIQISLNKSTYLDNESIMINIKVKNIGGFVDSIQNLHGYGIAKHILLINQNGKKLMYNSLIIDGISQYSIIKPDKEVNFDFDITGTHGSEYQESADPVKNRYIPQGNYKIEFIPDLRYFGKDLSSNTLTFEILQPTGFENDALNELKAIYKVKDIVERAILYRDFSLMHLESIYMEQTFTDYLSSIGVSNQVNKYVDTIIKDCKWFVETHSNSVQIKYVLEGCELLLEKYKDKSDAAEYLKIVISQYPNTKASNEAQILLDKSF